jgi:TMEM175 potassium channel family protein
MQPRDDQPAALPRPWGRVSTIRLETFSDSVFAIAVTLLALQLHPPNLTGASSAGVVLHALGQQLRPFGFYTLAFLLTGRLWIEHHRLLDPLETHGRHLAATNLWFLFTVSLLPYWVSVMAAYPNNSAAAGLFVLWMGVAQAAFVLVCLLVRRELAAGSDADELIVPKVIRAANAAVLLAVLGGLLVAQVPLPDAVIIGWLLLLVVGGRSAVRVWSARHRRQSADA